MPAPDATKGFEGRPGIIGRFRIVNGCLVILFLLCSNCTPPRLIPDDLAQSGNGLKQANVEAIWVDADPVSRPNQTADIDDVLAIRMLMNAGVPILGLSTVRGNGSEEAVWESATEAFPALPLFRGSSVSGCQSPAVIALLAASQQQSLTILALGPLTNIAMALRCDRSLAERVNRIIAVAGRSVGERFSLANDDDGPVLRDLNFELDRSAFRIVLESGVPVDLVPFAAGNRIRLGYRDLSRLPPHLRERAWSWSLILWFMGGGGTLPAFDQTAAALLLWPGAFDLEHVATEAGDHLILKPAATTRTTSVRRCLPLDAEAVRQAIVQRTR